MTQGDGLLQVLNLAGGAAQPNISGNQILSIKTVIATKEILNSFHLIANENINQILNLQNQNLLLKESRDILLPRLMSGKVGV
jgi:type I restriction enzyme S subunit